mmetsp:Transcript_12056/g.29600  ORF Transcript_12056/g.29600 Transcript_12056/m.29600 type:complete len:303 (+) Transcript_12056:94-1002(+)
MFARQKRTSKKTELETGRTDPSLRYERVTGAEAAEASEPSTQLTQPAARTVRTTPDTSTPPVQPSAPPPPATEPASTPAPAAAPPAPPAAAPAPARSDPAPATSAPPQGAGPATTSDLNSPTVDQVLEDLEAAEDVVLARLFAAMDPGRTRKVAVTDPVLCPTIMDNSGLADEGQVMEQLLSNEAVLESGATGDGTMNVDFGVFKSVVISNAAREVEIVNMWVNLGNGGEMPESIAAPDCRTGLTMFLTDLKIPGVTLTEELLERILNQLMWNAGAQVTFGEWGPLANRAARIVRCLRLCPS